MNYLLRGKYVFTDFAAGDAGLLRNAGVLVSEGEIRAVGDGDELARAHPEAETLGGTNSLVMPGLIDAHSHGNGLSHVQRGVGFDFLENALYDWANCLALPPELSAPLAALRHMKNGCTMMHHNEMGMACDENAYGKLTKVIGAYRSAGLRAAVSPGIRDMNFLANDDEAFYETLPEELRAFAKPLVFFDKAKARDMFFDLFDTVYREFHSDMTKIFLGPNWAHGCTDEYLTRTRLAAERYGHVPVHIHTLQTPVQKAYGMKKFGMSLVERLDRFGLVDDNLTLGHAVYLSEKDIALLAAKGASVTHHASCNLAVRNGIAPAWFMEKAGVNVALGIDEKCINDDEDPFMELRMIYYLSRVSGFDLAGTPALSPYTVLRMGANNAARSLGVSDLVGTLTPGKRADVITVDLPGMENDPCVAPDMRPELMLIHRGLGRYVNDVLIDGKPVIRDKKCRTIDVPALYAEVRKAVQAGPSEKARAYAAGMGKLKPYMQAWYAGWENFPKEPYYCVNTRV